MSWQNLFLLLKYIVPSLLITLCWDLPLKEKYCLRDHSSFKQMLLSQSVKIVRKLPKGFPGCTKSKLMAWDKVSEVVLLFFVSINILSYSFSLDSLCFYRPFFWARNSRRLLLGRAHTFIPRVWPLLPNYLDCLTFTELGVVLTRHSIFHLNAMLITSKHWANCKHNLPGICGLVNWLGQHGVLMPYFTEGNNIRNEELSGAFAVELQIISWPLIIFLPCNKHGFRLHSPHLSLECTPALSILMTLSHPF